nr:hypothetical protein [uncultured Cellulosilyticum sp.]
MIAFRNLQHQAAFHDLLKQMDLSTKALKTPSQLLRRQLAFIYLIAYYQEDYKKYEGEAFYIEPDYDDIHFSIGGPTYLLENQIGTRRYGHEIILEAAKAVLEGKEIKVDVADETVKFLIHEAKCFVKEKENDY